MRLRQDTAARGTVASDAIVSGACDAGDRLQIFVDRPQLPIGPVLIGGPRHHLKQIAIERWVEAVIGDGDPIDSFTAVWMKVIMVNALPDRVEEFGERGTPLREMGLIGR